MQRFRAYGVPVTVAVVIAVVCMGTVFFVDFRLGSDVQHKGVTMITAAVVERAGATVSLTQPSPQPAKPKVTPDSVPSPH